MRKHSELILTSNSIIYQQLYTQWIYLFMVNLSQNNFNVIKSVEIDKLELNYESL